ncbi:thiol-disulfide oxidoreductase [Botrimarina colliarenosi]|uniref:Thiol-disulfide oxidoreductase n=1 Tax=Botrimarina colliarenosi TaxID=2528001 RepID=A0A5C6AHT7_9BACT|nr:TlpA disulfide reductase family protein [Botrimarina colliarenosi]TWT99564.1 thiol-disulfide oxidoreductase [Botrimarina colliarenosi]
MAFLRERRLVAAVALLACCSADPAPGQTGSGAERPEQKFTLPSDPRLWHNSPPLSMESLAGKGVVFYFFEEECPRCAANWPNLQGLSKQYEGKPVLFIGVNSGSDPRVLKRYLAQNRVGWPIIHDYDRSLETAMGVPKLSLQGEVFAVRYVAGDGSMGNGQGADFAGTAESALRGAEWRVDPKTVPPKLLSAWRAIELGDFAAAARPVYQAADSKDDDLKAGGDRLLEAVQAEVTEAAESAQESLSEGDEWAAYKGLEGIGHQFAGYEFDLVERAKTKAKELAKSDAVKDQLAASRLLDKAMATASRGGSGAMNRAKGLLKRVVEDYPSTESAGKAQELLATVDAAR